MSHDPCSKNPGGVDVLEFSEEEALFSAVDTPVAEDKKSRWYRRIALFGVALLAFCAGYWLHTMSTHRVSSVDGANAPAGSEMTSEPPSNSTIVVDIHGDVHHPGVYVLPADARVKDAVAAAGGCIHPDDVKYFNAAAVLDDGGEVVIPNAAEQRPSQEALSWVSSNAAGTEGENRAKIDINSATVETLETLPGIGPAKAAAIVRFRSTHGPLRQLGDLLQVPGIGKTTLEHIAPYVNLPNG
jgi:competence protein ComEA